MGVGGQHHVPSNLTQGKDAVPIVHEAGRISGLVWTGAENLAPTGIRTPNRKGRGMYLRINYICQQETQKSLPSTNKRFENIPRMWGKFHVCLKQYAFLQITKVYVGSNKKLSSDKWEGCLALYNTASCTGNLHGNSIHFLFDTYAVSARKKQLLFIYRLSMFSPSHSATQRNLLPSSFRDHSQPSPSLFPRHLIANSTEKRQIPI